MRFPPIGSGAFFWGGRSRVEALSAPAVARWMQQGKDRARIGQSGQALHSQANGLRMFTPPMQRLPSSHRGQGSFTGFAYGATLAIVTQEKLFSVFLLYLVNIRKAQMT